MSPGRLERRARLRRYAGIACPRSAGMILPVLFVRSFTVAVRFQNSAIGLDLGFMRLARTR
jgi:hypothetical protein